MKHYTSGEKREIVRKAKRPSLEYQAKQKLRQLDDWIGREARKQGAWAWEPNATENGR